MSDRREPTTWDVSVEFVASGPEDFDLRVADDLVSATLEYEGVVSVLPRTITIDITVDVKTPRKALSIGISAAQDALRVVGLPDALPIERIEATTARRAEQDLEQPTYPEMLGVSEVAELLGVSKQRVSELRERGRLPVPFTELRAGPIWPRPAIERFLERWDRKPGRPAADRGIA